MLTRSLPIAAALCVLIVSCCLGANYRIVDLGVPSWDTGCVGTAINDVGQVVGDTNTGAFIWDAAGGMRNLNIQAGQALSINNHGQVSGYGNTVGRGDYNHAFVWSEDTGLRDLGALGSDTQSWGAYIRDDGHVFGGSHGSQGYRLFEWDIDGGMRDLGANLPTDKLLAGPLSVTQSGQIIGSLSGRPKRAFVWDATNGIRDLGPGFVYAANSQGVAVGTTGELVAVAAMWDTAGVRTLLETLPGLSESWAYGVNNAGVVVGEVRSSSGQEDAFVWENGTGMLLLPTLGGQYGTIAYAVNSTGIIVGGSYAPDGWMHAVLWEPVPEPSSLLTLGAGILALAGAFRKRR